MAILAIAVLAMAFPFVKHAEAQPEGTMANAWSTRIFCNDGLGSMMNSQGAWNIPLISNDFPAQDGGTRRMTAQEAFGWNMLFVAYHGETDPDENDSWTNEEQRSPEDAENVVKNNDDGNEGKDALERVYDQRTWTNCSFGSLTNGMANGALKWAQVMASLVSSFSTFAFNTNFVCEDPGAPNQGACVDLLFIVGGDGSAGSDGGLVGALTQSIYVPLIVLVAMLVGIWVFYQGIVQRKLRESLWGVIWAFVAVIAGLAFLLNPAMLAKAPAVVSNTLAGCVISAFGGTNCAGDVTPQNDPDTADSSKICVAEASSADPSERMQLIASSLSCSIWKAFVLEPYTQASFGTSFSNLDTARGQGRELVEAAGRNPNDFCVNLSSTRSLNSMKGKELVLDSGFQDGRICNIALYQIYLQTYAESSTDGGYEPMESGTRTVDKRWYRIVDVTSTNTATWTTWAPGSDDGQLSAGVLAFITAVVGGIVLIVISIFAILFYMSSILLIAFAPLFFLIGVHPGKGRDILKGYGEMVLSNVFKYIASALFLIVALALYGGVLGSSNSQGMTLLMVIILSLALFLYRRELVDLIGTVNMGGTQVGKTMSDKLSRKFGFRSDSDLMRMGQTALGSAAGAKLAGGSIIDGAAEGISRDLKRGGGLLGRMGTGLATGRDFVSADNKQKLTHQHEDLKADETRARQAAEDLGKESAAATGEYNKTAERFNTLQEAIEALAAEVKNKDNRKDVLEGMAAKGGDSAQFAKAMSLQGEIANLNRDLASGTLTEEQERATTARITDLTSQRGKISDQLVANGSFNDLKRQYETDTAGFRDAAGRLNSKIAERNDLMPTLQAQETNAQDLAVRADVAAQQARIAATATDAFGDAKASVRKGRAITGGVMREIGEKTQEAAREEYDQGVPLRRVDELTETEKSRIAGPVAVVDTESLRPAEDGQEAIPTLEDAGAGQGKQGSPVPTPRPGSQTINPEAPVIQFQGTLDNDAPPVEQPRRGGLPTNPTGGGLPLAPGAPAAPRPERKNFAAEDSSLFGEPEAAGDRFAQKDEELFSTTDEDE